jgi:uncharacterized protein YndB with AHSA1/START domain
MAHNCRTIPVHPETVFELLIDPSSYPEWLIGAESIDTVDRDWPHPGSRFHHTVGIGRIRFHDYSEVLEIDAPNRLKLSVHATPLVRGVVSFELHGDDAGTVLCLEEEPERRRIGNLLRPVLDPMTHLRNHRSLLHFAELVRRESAEGAQRSAKRRTT